MISKYIKNYTDRLERSYIPYWTKQILKRNKEMKKYVPILKKKKKHYHQHGGGSIDTLNSIETVMSSYKDNIKNAQDLKKNIKELKKNLTDLNNKLKNIKVRPVQEKALKDFIDKNSANYFNTIIPKITTQVDEVETEFFKNILNLQIVNQNPQSITGYTNIKSNIETFFTSHEKEIKKIINNQENKNYETTWKLIDQKIQEIQAYNLEQYLEPFEQKNNSMHQKYNELLKTDVTNNNIQVAPHAYNFIPLLRQANAQNHFEEDLEAWIKELEELDETDKALTYNKKMKNYSTIIKQKNKVYEVNNKQIQNELINKAGQDQQKISNINNFFNGHKEDRKHKIRDYHYVKSRETVTNNILKADSATHQKINIDTLHQLIGIEKDLFDTKIEELYVPDFKKFNIQIGGAKSAQQVKVKYEELKNIKEKFDKDTDQYYKLIKEYNEWQMKFMHYIIYLLLIGTNQIVKTSYAYFIYIDRPFLDFYRRELGIMKNNKDKMEKLGPILKKKYDIVIDVLYAFLTTLVQELAINEILDIKACSEDIQNKFLLFNSFYPIIEKHKGLNPQNLTIYSRINDFGTIKNVAVTYKTFFSEKELLPTGETDRLYINFDSCKEKYYKDLEDEIQKVEDKIKNNSTKKLKKKKQKLEKELQNRKKKYDEGFEGLKKKLQKGKNNMKYLRLSQVFDSKNTPSNDSLATQTLINYQLTKQENIAVTTYGYSGVGKTFTIFGSKRAGKKGLLQSALDLEGLISVDIRIFELYGSGANLQKYWNDLNDINSKLFAYKVAIIGEKNNQPIDPKELGIGNIREIEDNEHISNYINNDEDFTTISSIQIGENIFGTFDNLVEAIDDERRKHERIRATPNNPESSRSIMIYNFKFKFDIKQEPGQPKKKDDAIFLIVDLPGREDILRSFPDSYLIENEFISNTLKLKETSMNKQIYEVLHLTLSAMALNPLILPLIWLHETETSSFYDGVKNTKNTFNNGYLEFQSIIYDVINKESLKKNRKAILGDELESFYPNTNLNLGDEIWHPIIVTNKSYPDLKKLLKKKSSKRPILIKHLIDIDETNWKFKNMKNQKPQLNRTGDFGNWVPNDIQWHAIITMIIMKRIILSGQFKILKKINDKIVEKLLNDVIIHKIENANNNDLKNYFTILLKFRYYKNIYKFKNMKDYMVKYDNLTELQKKNLSDKKPQDIVENTYSWNKPGAENELKKVLKNQLIYDYTRATSEGIFINENIAGFIKYLAENIGDIKNYTVEKQKTTDLNKMAQSFITLIKGGLYLGTNLTMNLSQSNKNKLYEEIEAYSSQRMFNEEPIMETVLSKYTKKNSKDKITDCKVLFLKTNVDDKRKCKAQIEMVNTSYNFISKIIEQKP